LGNAVAAGNTSIKQSSLSFSNNRAACPLELDELDPLEELEELDELDELEELDELDELARPEELLELDELVELDELEELAVSVPPQAESKAVAVNR
jgi:hypothetical protein